MALKVVQTVNFKRDNGTLVFNNTIGNVAGAPITKEANSNSECDALVAAEITGRVAAVQGNVDELNAILAAFQS